MVKIGEIISQNPWWSQGEEFALYDPYFKGAKPIFFERRSFPLEKGAIYILRGCRQVGKTTYLKEIIRGLIQKGIPPRHILYLSLDFFTSRRELRNAVTYFLDLTVEADQVYLFFDEITALEGWNLELKYLADQGITQRAIVMCSGSSAFRIKEKGELLPGRGLEGNEYHFKPLTFREFVLQTAEYIGKFAPSEEFSQRLTKLMAILPKCYVDLDAKLEEVKGCIAEIIPYKKEVQYLFRIYLTTGGMPLVINHYFDQRFEKSQEGIGSAISEIFMRSVLGDLSHQQKQEILIRKILRAILEKYGSRYSFSKLSREIEQTHVTTIDYLNLMEESFILFVHYAYDFSKKDIKYRGDKKVYFIDPFIYYAIQAYLNGSEVWEVITKVSQDEAIQSHLVEGVVLSHLLLHKELPYLRKGRTFLWTYYDKAGREIDAVFRGYEGYRGIEVKYQAEVDERGVRRVTPIRDYILLSREDIGGKGNVLIAPVDLFLSLLPGSERNL